MRTPTAPHRAIHILACLLLGFSSLGTGAAAAGSEPRAATYNLDIPSQKLNAALQALALASRHQLFYQADLVDGKNSPPLKGQFTAEEAIQRLLAGTNLAYEITPQSVVFIRPRKAGEEVSAAGSAAALRLVQADASPSASAAAEEPADKKAADKNGKDVTADERVPEILVRGSHVLNMDIQRSVNDAQPYVIFDRETIQRSGAINLEDFFKNRLTMNTVAGTNSQNIGATRSTSQVNLRGLGTNQTLILVDGHRVSSPNNLGVPLQPDLNGIPLSAVERVEILPSTASGIYGGSAVGGVVNVVLRRDYRGLEAKFGYENTFDTDAALTNVSINAGFGLEGGKTQIMISGSFSDQNILDIGDRDFLRRGRDQIVANRGTEFLPTDLPPLGYLPNYRAADNLPLFDGDPAQFAFIPRGYDGGGTLDDLRAGAGHYNLDLAQTAQGDGALKAMVNNPRVESANATIRREFSSRVQAFLDLSVSNNNGRYQANLAPAFYFVPEDAPTNPFGRLLIVTAATTRADATYAASVSDRRAVGGIIVDLTRRWRLEADYTWSRNRMWSDSIGDLRSFDDDDGLGGDDGPGIDDAIMRGDINVLRDTSLYPIDLSPYVLPALITHPVYTSFKDATLRVAGPIWTLPGGGVTLSALIEDRREIYEEGLLSQGEYGQISPERSQVVRSAYTELQVPLVSVQNRLPGLESLDVQLAVRRDNYTTVGSTAAIDPDFPTPVVHPKNELNSTDPTFGLRYKPLRDVMLRASYGTGFLPPSVTQLVRSEFGSAFNLGRDPKRGNTTVRARNRGGGNPDLLPEESKSWSAGIVFTPQYLNGLRISLDYTSIDKTGNIVALSNQQIINNEDAFPGRVVRNAPSSTDMYPVGTIASVDNSLVNIARASVAAYDMQVDYHLDTAALGTFDFFALATRQITYETQILPTSPLINNIGVAGTTVGTLLPLKANGGVTWTRGNLTLGWNTRYFDKYRAGTSATAIRDQGNDGVVSSQTYHDFFSSYRFGSTAPLAMLTDTEIQFGVKNVFNTRPPFDSTFPLYFSLFGDPRLASYYVTLRKSF